jgi:hypothetical protein
MEPGDHLSKLKAFDFLSQLVLCSAQFLLKPAQQLIVLALGKGQIIIGELSVFLLQFALYFVPTPFELQFCHSDNCFARQSKIGRPACRGSLPPLLKRKSPRAGILRPKKTAKLCAEIRIGGMKKCICLLASVALLAACEQKETTVTNPPAEKKESTTVINQSSPPATKEKTEVNVNTSPKP